jgi:hypothetical protein
MQCIFKYANGMLVSNWNQCPDINFKFWKPVTRTLYIYVNKVVRIRGYFSKTEGLREQNSLENTGLHECYFGPLCFHKHTASLQ